jgi:hypothetical protein
MNDMNGHELKILHINTLFKKRHFLGELNLHQSISDANRVAVSLKSGIPDRLYIKQTQARSHVFKQTMKQSLLCRLCSAAQIIFIDILKVISAEVHVQNSNLMLNHFLGRQVACKDPGFLQ